MLALTRRIGESVMINDNIEVHVVSITNKNVKLGIHAPRRIPIYRKEIYDQIVKANKKSVAGNTIEIDINDLKRIFDEE